MSESTELFDWGAFQRGVEDAMARFAATAGTAMAGEADVMARTVQAMHQAYLKEGAPYGQTQAGFMRWMRQEFYPEAEQPATARSDPSAYTVLGVARDADPALIEAAFRELAKRYHPDVPGGSAEKMTEFNVAMQQVRARLADPR